MVRLEADIYIITSRKSPRAGPGKYISVLAHDIDGTEYTKTLRNSFDNVTPHALELQALTDSLKRFKKPCGIHIHSAHGWIRSVYENGWLKKWQASGWINNGKPIANAELYQNIEDIKNDLHLEFIGIDDDLGAYQTWLNNEIRKEKE